MDVSRFSIRLTCACGRTTEYESTLARPGGMAPIPCGCGRRFAIQQLEASEVGPIEIDPTGVTKGRIPEDPPEFH